MIADYFSCNYKACREEQRMGRIYRAEKDPAYLRRQLPAIRALADGEKEALGFLPEPAYREALERRRLIAMCSAAAGDTEVAGFILFSGVFPNARIQQVVVAREHRRAGAGSALINELVSHLEARAYLTLSAAVASDLSAAQAFYERNGFVARRTLPGGQARNRSIILRTRYLETENLFSVLEPPSGASPSAVDLGLRKRSAGQAPLSMSSISMCCSMHQGQRSAALAPRRTTYCSGARTSDKACCCAGIRCRIGKNYEGRGD
jgi:ribosomal protein S18 acetylase RimI-like enzyme